MEKDSQEQDCAICLQKYHHPARLPCGHIFCFLCVKGIAILSKKCAICRTQIPSDYFDHPQLLDDISSEVILEPEIGKYHWYYEGRNGWWKYDERSNLDLESAFSSNETECLLLLAGTLYCVDFHNMVQFRRNDATKRRKVKRDITTLPSKGIAGIKSFATRTIQNLENRSDVNSHTIETQAEESEVILVTDVEVTIDDVRPTLADVTITTESIQSTANIDEITDRIGHINLRPEENSRTNDAPTLHESAEEI